MNAAIADAPPGPGPARRLASVRGVVRGAGPMAFAAVAANGSNVVVTVIIARFLTTRAYGALIELMAVLIGLTMPGSALLVAVVRRVTAWGFAGEERRVDAWVRDVRRWGLIALTVWAVGALLVRGWVAQQLGLPSPAGAAEVMIAGGSWALLSVERGLIQSRRAYIALARNLCVEAGVRTAVTLTLVGAGLGVEGAALGLVAAVAASIVDARRTLRRLPDRPATGDAVLVVARAVSLEIGLDDNLEDDLEERSDRSSGPGEQDQFPSVNGNAGARVGRAWPPLARYRPYRGLHFRARPTSGRRHLTADLLTALASLALLAGLQNIDVLIVGRHSSANGGPYGAISVACKSVVFGATVLAGYLLPEAVARYHQGEHALRQLAVALGLVALPAVSLAVIAAVAPTTMLNLAFGPDKAQGAPAFATLAVAMGCLSATVLLTHYLLAIGRRSIVAVLAVGMFVLVATVSAAHGQLVATARAELACQAGLAAVTAFFVLAVPRSGGRQRIAFESGSRRA